MDTLDNHKGLNDGMPDDQALLKYAIQQTCSNLTIYCRDANLPEEYMHKYKRGMVIRERGFVDATALCGGIVTNHRYMILSNQMKQVPMLEQDPQWALHLANKDSRFLVLGKAKGEGARGGGYRCEGLGGALRETS